MKKIQEKEEYDTGKREKSPAAPQQIREDDEGVCFSSV